MRRPEDVVRDVRGLKLRQRVSLVLNDKVLRDELEDLVQNYVQNGPKTSGEGVRTYQDFLVPSSTYYGGGMSAVVTPIADIRGSDTLNYSKQERLLRCKLASTYRLVDLFGWNSGLYSFITIRPSTDQESFLIHPFGLLYSEVTAASLQKVNPDGSVVDQGSTNLGVNKAGMLLHSAIHGARKDARAIIHLHEDAIVAVSAMKCGLLPISIEALALGEIAYHDFRGILTNEEEKESIVKDLGEESKVMVLRNHGIVVCGETIEEALALAHSAVKACSFQVKAVGAGVDNLIKCEDFAREQVNETVQEGGGGVNSSEMKWKRAEREILKHVQRRAFPEELHHPEKPVKKRSRLYKLDPIIIDELLCVGGRLRKASLPLESKNQIILPKEDHITRLIIDDYRICGHSGREHVLALIREKFWITQGSSTVKSVLAECVSCRRRQAPLCKQKMADLPESRVLPDKPPFAAVGVDYFGPFQVRRGRCLVKRYGVIFTCLAIRAVHIEIAHSLDTDSFLLALRRFIDKRGFVRRVKVLTKTAVYERPVDKLCLLVENECPSTGSVNTKN